MSAPLHNNEQGAPNEVVDEKQAAPATHDTPAAAPAPAPAPAQQEGAAPAAPAEKKAGRFDKTFVRPCHPIRAPGEQPSLTGTALF